MAKELKIEDNYFVIFDNGTNADEIRFPAGGVIPKYSGNDVDFYQFQPVSIKLNVSTYDATAIVDNRTGATFASLAAFKTFVSQNTGFFFDNLLIRNTIEKREFGFDAGGRTRVSQITTLLDGKTLGIDDTDLFENVGTGSASFANNKVNLSVTAGQYII